METTASKERSAREEHPVARDDAKEGEEGPSDRIRYRRTWRERADAERAKVGTRSSGFPTDREGRWRG